MWLVAASLNIKVYNKRMFDDDTLALKAEQKALQYGIANCRLDVPSPPRHFTLSLLLLICLLVSAVLELQCRIWVGAASFLVSGMTNLRKPMRPISGIHHLVIYQSKN